MSQTIILTGSTGFVGSSLLGDILRQDPSARVRLLVRASSKEAAYQRVSDAAAITAPDIDPSDIQRRCDVFLGDLTSDGLGLSKEVMTDFATDATNIIHCASAVSFQQTLDEARATNVEGTRRMLSLARISHASGSLLRFAYVGTAYVSGDRRGRILENDDQVPERFTNSYEQSKFEAEVLVREAMKDLPCTILRPSIIVGNSRTGSTLCFNVLYIPLRLMAAGLIREFAGRPDIPMDVVPVDYVSRAIYELSCNTPDADGKTYHLTMGDRASTAGEIVRTANEYFSGSNGRVSTALSFVTPTPVPQSTSSRAAKALSMFEGYVTISRVFDNVQSAAVLAPKGITPPPYASYCSVLFDYCLRTNWGRQLRAAA